MEAGRDFGRAAPGCAMLYDPKYAKRHDRLEDGLRVAPAITPELMRGVMSQTCVRLPALGHDAKARLSQLIECGAWTDAALALIDLELPQWKLRRVIFEDGEWLCSLSRQPALPLGLDELAEATHKILPLAILMAFLEARRTVPVGTSSATAVPQVRPLQGVAVFCDNFR
jgi:hypothetical protein